MGAGTLADPARLLAAWEAAAAVPGIARGAALVHAAGAVEDLDVALDLGVGELASLAAHLHAEAFGSTVDGVLRCAGCGELLDVTVPLPRSAAGAGAGIVHLGGRALVVRPPSTRDLMAASAAPDPVTVLLARCVAGPVDTAALDGEALAAVDAAAEELAGPAAVVIATRCPACGATVRASLDVAGVLWARVRLAAPALLAEVAQLAAAFGWSEAEVLALTPGRRRAYLGLAREGSP